MCDTTNLDLTDRVSRGMMRLLTVPESPRGNVNKDVYRVLLKSTQLGPVVRESLEARGQLWGMYICWISE